MTIANIPTLYHFTDRRNLPSIRELGGLYSLARLNEMGVTIAAPGGNQWSHEADEGRGLDRFVHLCFKPTHPMEFRAREDGRVGDSIFLQIHPEVLEREGVRFTADVSNKAGVVIQTLEEAKDIIDFEVLYSRTDWRDPQIQHRLQQAEKSEILVPDSIPLELIRNLPNG
jgi:ssDNA thymidine ADP-ribosyltransferase DarT-like protein